LPFSIDPRAYVHPHTPNKLFVASYNGVVGSRFLATAQYSQKRWGVRDNGNTSTDILDSPFLTRTGAQYQFNAPYFDSTDPEDCNNRHCIIGDTRGDTRRDPVWENALHTASLFPDAPAHRQPCVLRLRRENWQPRPESGVERFTSTRVGGNSQTSTGYVFQSDFAVGADGKPLLDANGRLVPRFVPGTSRIQNWMPVRGAQRRPETIRGAGCSAGLADQFRPRLQPDCQRRGIDLGAARAQPRLCGLAFATVVLR